MVSSMCTNATPGFTTEPMPVGARITTPAKGAAPAIWKIDCDGNDLWFGLRNGRWLHTGYENVNE